ncbi:MAG: dihydrolipoamide acetyltransferase family protein [Planctomycetota bacterium]|jgi:pyruvate dehydrogenase E2 component (dihydrolipoamide acetyltransferase)
MSVKQPADQSAFILPDLGEGVHEAELIKWRVAAGDTVKEHQILAEMETDKALVEVPSPWAGKIRELHGKEGEILNVGNVLVSYDVAGGSSTSAPASGDSKAGDAAAAGADEDAGTVVGTMSGELSVSARFARRPESEPTQPSRKALATPAVRRIARELGVDIDRVPATGRGGRVTASDVQAAASGAATAPAHSSNGVAATPPRPAPVERPAIDGEGTTERIPFRGVRRKIAQALDLSVKTAVHFTVVEEADVTALLAKRAEYARVLGRKLSLLPFAMYAVCRALAKHPELNAIVDDAGEAILRKGPVNLGCAVDTEHGLMVPVIRNAQTLGPVELADQVKSLADACRGRSVEREHLVGGTFTVSNVGSHGGMFATPIINYPEVAILGLGRSREKVLVKDGRFYAGSVLPMSLSCDHRVVDGAAGAAFLGTVVRLLESPEELLGG